MREVDRTKDLTVLELQMTTGKSYKNLIMNPTIARPDGYTAFIKGEEDGSSTLYLARTSEIASMEIETADAVNMYSYFWND